MNMSTKTTKSKLSDSKFPLKLGLPPTPPWRRRVPAPGPGSGAGRKIGVQLTVVQGGQAT
ncbi:MAG: hypothetical protein AMXMBFR33_62080 [Candidatus Xenobia bacterium]